MNDNEAIDRAIALLEKQRPQKKPRELWGVMKPNSGWVVAVFFSRRMAEHELEGYRQNGAFGPYSLAHIVEVID